MTPIAYGDYYIPQGYHRLRRSLTTNNMYGHTQAGTVLHDGQGPPTASTYRVVYSIVFNDACMLHRVRYGILRISINKPPFPAGGSYANRAS